MSSHSLSSQLRYALGNIKPFQRFKQLIEESGEYRRQWFDFRDVKTVAWVREQLQRLF